MSIRVVIADDHPVVREGLRLKIESGGKDIAVVGEASDGQEVLEIVKTRPADVAILDIVMPNMNGIDALKAIRKIDGRAKVIMCTAMGQKSMVIESIQSGAVDFIVKPFQPDRVLQTITKVVEG